MLRKLPNFIPFLLLFFILSIPCLLPAQNNPFGEDTTVTNPQSTGNPFAVETSQQTSSAVSEVTIEVSGSWVNIRSGPGTGNQILDTLPRGTTGRFLSEKDGWYEVDFGNGLTGWISGKYAERSTLSVAAETPGAGANLAAANSRQFERWQRHLGNDILDFSRFPWYWRLNRAQKKFEKGDYQKAYDLARKSSGNPLESAYMQAMCLDKMGQHDKAARLLKLLEKPLEDVVFNRKLEQIARPYVDEPIVFKFGGYDDIDTFKQKKAAGNRIGLESSEYYEKYVDINTWKWRSNKAYQEFQKIGGIDCSGFVQMIQKEAFAKTGVKFPIDKGRTSTSGLWSEKYTKEINPGVKPPPPPDIRPGDMILLDYGHNRFGHSMIYKGKDSQGNILVMQMGDTAQISTLSPSKYQYYKGTYRMNGMDEVRKALTA